MEVMDSFRQSVYAEVAASEVKKIRTLCTHTGNLPIDDLDRPRGGGWYYMGSTNEELHNPQFPGAYIREDMYVRWKTILGDNVNVVGGTLMVFPE